MLNRDEIFLRLRPLITKIMGVPADKVQPDTAFIDDLDVASLDLVELVMEIEKNFNVDIPEDQIDKIVRVKDAVSFIEARLH